MVTSELSLYWKRDKLAAALQGIQEEAQAVASTAFDQIFHQLVIGSGRESKRWPEWFGKSGGLGGLGDPDRLGTKYLDLSSLD